MPYVNHAKIVNVKPTKKGPLSRYGVLGYVSQRRNAVYPTKLSRPMSRSHERECHTGPWTWWQPSFLIGSTSIYLLLESLADPQCLFLNCP